jgi:hypothetical protein
VAASRHSIVQSKQATTAAARKSEFTSYDRADAEAHHRYKGIRILIYKGTSPFQSEPYHLFSHLTLLIIHPNPSSHPLLLTIKAHPSSRCLFLLHTFLLSSKNIPHFLKITSEKVMLRSFPNTSKTKIY